MTTPKLPIPLVDLWAIHEPMFDELQAAFDRVVRSSAFSGGREVEGFEAELATFCGTTKALGVGSGTVSLQLALMAAGIGAGDEVILPANTFFATFEAVVLAGATPVLADAYAATANIDVEHAATLVTDKTAAIIPVHLYGQPADMDAVNALAAKHGLFVLEDAAQAIGAAWDGKPAGSLGNVGSFSFYAGKNLGALGEAGAVTSDDEELLHKVHLLRQHGQPRRYEHDVVGMNERMDGMQAAFLSAKLAHLGQWQAERDRLFARYEEQLAEVEGARVLDCHDKAVRVHHLLPVFLQNRDAVLEGLHERQVGAGIHYPHALHLLPPGRECGEPGSFPVAEELTTTTLSLPLYPGMSDDQVDYCVTSLVESMKAAQ